MPFRPLALLLGLLFAAPFSMDGGQRHEGADRTWDAEHLNLDLAIDPYGGTVSGTATWTLHPHPNAEPSWAADLVGLRIRDLTVDGAPAPFRVTDTAVIVELKPDQAHKVAISYDAKPNSGLHFRTPGANSPDRYPEVWSQGEDVDNRHWFPLPDGPEDRFTLDGTLRLPEAFTAQVVGESQQSAPGRIEFRMDKPIAGYLVALSVLPADTTPVVISESPRVSIWTGPGHPRELLEAEGRLLPEMMKFFAEKTGVPFPWPQYREVYVQRFIYGGMENPSMTIMARGLLGEGASPRTTPERESVSAHEMAHQWYGDLLTCRSWSELWLNEGFATFFASEWTRTTLGEADYAKDTLSQAAAGAGAGPMASRPWSTPAGDHGVNDRVYVRGAAVLRTLRAMVGEEAFWASIRRYTRDNSFELVETDDLRKAVEAETGLRLRWFFDQWVHLPGSPELSVRQSYEAGQLRLRFSQQLPEGRDPWILALDLEIGGAGEVVRRRVWLDEATIELTLDLPAAPRWVAVDPDGVLIGTLQHDQPTSALVAQLGSPSAAARLRAVRALGEAPGAAEASAALLPLLADPDPVWVEEAAAALGKLGSEVGNAALAQLLLDAGRGPRERIAAAQALGATTGPGGAREALTDALRGLRDPRGLQEEDLAAAVLRALRAHDRELAAKEARKILAKAPKATWHAPRHVAALWVLARQDAAEDLPLVLRYIDPKLAPPVLFEAMRAGVRIAAEDADLERKVARAIEPLLADAFQDTRSVALSSLAEVGDEDTRRALDAYMRAEDTPWLLDQARTAAAAVSAREHSPPPEEAALNARLEALDKRLEALEKDVGALHSRR